MKVSVIMPVYNAENFIGQSIQSVLKQTFEDFELIVIDDGSTDSSKNIILSFDDKRIQYLQNEKNMGVVKTLNKGISICSGEYIIRMDADDICEPQRFEKQIQFIEKNPGIGLCGTWAQVIDEKNKITGKIVNQTDPGFISISLLFSVPLIHPSVCFKSHLLKQNFYKEVPVAEDYELWCRLNEQTRLANLPEFLFQYRWHTSNISKEKQDIQEQNKESIIKKELLKLSLKPDDETLRIHRLSFTLYSFGNETKKRVSATELKQSGRWFNTLISANKKANRYDRHKFVAFLWIRWIVLCLSCRQKQKILFPPFASCNPKVLYYLAKQIILMARK